MLDGLYDRLVHERLSAELASLIQANQASVLAVPAEERSARLGEVFVQILTGILDAVARTASVSIPSESMKVSQENMSSLDLEHCTECSELAAAVR